MLLELRVGQLALVDELVLPLGPGLTVLTGETGAGKSLIAGAFSLLCGARAPKALVRQGEDVAYAEGVFDLGQRENLRAWLGRSGIRIGSDGILVLRRELRRQGRSRVLINGLISSLALLEQIGPRLLCIQSQDQQRELTDPGFARALLDHHLACGSLLPELREQWARYQQAHAALQQRQQESALATEQLDIWQYQYAELTEARLDIREEERLAEELALKRHASSLQEGAISALNQLTEGESPARVGLGACISILGGLADKSRKLATILDSLKNAEASIAEASLELNRFLDLLDLDPAGLAELEARKALYEELRRKFGRETQELLDLQEILRLRIAKHESTASDLAEMNREVELAREELERLAQQLHRLRATGAPDVSSQATARIRPLALPDLELEFRVTERRDAQGIVTIDGQPSRVTADGADSVELLVRTNPGERMGPVGDIASGGERSRIHLGLTAFQQGDRQAPLLLFDEIDAGLGMDAARPVAALMLKMAKRGQVICITHLPTMAVHCSAHLKVAKQTQNGRTVLRLENLDPEARVAEIARLLGGEGWGSGDEAAQNAYALELVKQGRQHALAEGA